jgi:predicted transcriptional regulator
VYVSSPTKALVGMFEVKTVISEFVPELWRRVQYTCGISYERFSKYYAGAKQGFGIAIRHAWFLPRPLELSYLRQEWASFWPPQGYRYLSPEEVQRVQMLAS